MMKPANGLGAIGNLDYAVLLCRDVPPMRDFYLEVMGFQLEFEVPGKWAEFQLGASRIALRQRTRPYDGAHPDLKTAAVQLAFEVPLDQIEAVVSQLEEGGVELLEPVADLEPFGHRALFFNDPEYNIIEVFALLRP